MSDSLKKLSCSNTEFGLDLYRKFSSSDADGNIFFSPMSISLALAMTSLGARDKTELEMKSVLKLDKMTNKDIHEHFRKLVDDLKKSNDKFILHIANKLYGEKSNSFLNEFLKSCEEFYGAALEPVDFRNKAKECEATINAWVENQTNQKIRNLIAPGSLNAMTKLVLVNAIYFKGSWDIPFDESNTKEDKFYISENHTTQISLMHFSKKKLRYSFDEELKCQILELPYEGRRLSYVIILPDLEKTKLEEVEQKLTGTILQNISNHLYTKEVNVWLPRFKLESTPNVMRALMELGLQDLFDSRADLSNMNGEKNLFVSSILHKAFIEVNEKGSEAAGATAVIIGKKSLRHPAPSIPVDFRADHPFIFSIKDIESGSILFLGKFLKP
ncbi:hypothetical protein HELRODRAFT_86140 [Helobdella robusta]|uniref:Serpin domain-containing protein n=1 Tax=Helobdella robusta TaxID=6412 RepID=T1G677_HELRO|nr:hypothetical protein HELRODRAFT_86140 [Helobdella robusta]ESN95906.1 hypothetical protein HELRODRAFT_86140 [Helobdella robusta]